MTMMEENPVLWAENLDVYQKKTRVLSEVNFSIQKGELVYLIGKTGAGKSSLLRTLYADIPVRSGQVHVAGYALAT